MLIIIPLGGLGTRFKSCGYSRPKPLVVVMGKPILYWLLSNLVLGSDDYVVIPYNHELESYSFETMVAGDFPQINFIFHKLIVDTRGAAETLSQTLSMLEKDFPQITDSPILSLDGDNFYSVDIISLWGGGGKVFAFEDHGDAAIYSYVVVSEKCDGSEKGEGGKESDGKEAEEGRILKIIEKEKISNYACTGAYGFKSWKQLLVAAKEIITRDLRDKNEFYISTVIKFMIEGGLAGKGSLESGLETGEKFTMGLIPVDNYICLGTPLHVRLFCNNFPRINALSSQQMFQTKTYAFEIVDTLLSVSRKGVREGFVPNVKNIELVRYLKKLGHIIIINTYLGEFWYGLKVVDLLAEFKIPFDEIFYNSVKADYYVGGNSVSAFANLELELGFYNSVIQARDFHTVSLSGINKYRKEVSKIGGVGVGGKDLTGEIYYYLNIPGSLKDLFPILVDYDREIPRYWFEMEKINGIPVSKLFLSKQLSCSRLEHIMNSLHRIHTTPVGLGVGLGLGLGLGLESGSGVGLDSVNIYDNYFTKLAERYRKYVSLYRCSNFDKSHEVYTKLCQKLSVYEKRGLGKRAIIHGDPVMTNILINQFGKIKFIDMRGKVGEKLTIEGDLFYDWAKLYQSLIGYDEILDGVFLDKNYRSEMLEHFKKVFLQWYSPEEFEWVNILCQSLLFSLLPLHSDLSKQCKYFALAVSLGK